MSGQSNVIYWLEERHIDPDPELVEELFAACKSAEKVLPEEVAVAIVRQHGAGAHSQLL